MNQYFPFADGMYIVLYYNNLKYSWIDCICGMWIDNLDIRNSVCCCRFSNLGNTCYMNSILQALFCLVPFSCDLQRVVRKRFPSGPEGVLCR